MLPTVTHFAPSVSFRSLPAGSLSSPALSHHSPYADSNLPVVTAPAQSLIYQLTVSTLDNHKWRRNTLRFNGTHLVCLSPQKHRLKQMLILAHTTENWWPSGEMLTLTPRLDNPLVSTPRNPIRMLEGKSEFVKYWQRVEWTVELAEISSVEIVDSESVKVWRARVMGQVRVNLANTILLRFKNGGTRLLRAKNVNMQ